MVKTDSRRDYYGDLELSPTADANDVKRQYRQLGKRKKSLVKQEQRSYANPKLHICAALKYHPDRNPGHEAEFNAKFQAIQSAHDVLADPQQRAKYDADRIRSGLLYTYNSPTRPNVPPRTPNTTFPPPPRPPPLFTPKTTYASASGTNRSGNPGRGDSRTSWASWRNSTAAEDAKTKTSDFKAWEQMRHGQGTVPTERMAPPNYSGKTSTFSPGHDARGGMPKDSFPKRSGWDQFKDIHPGLARSKTARVPKNDGFAPWSPAPDEPPARASTAYAHSRPERPSSRHYPVPPPRPNQTAQKPDPLQHMKKHLGPDQFTRSGRVSTPYATVGGEKTYFSSQGLRRSTSWREGTDASEWYDSEPNGTEKLRPGATTADRNKSASPKMKSPPPRSPSSSSSTSSSDESIEMQMGGRNFYRPAPPSSQKQNAKASEAMDEHRRPGSKPSVTFDHVDDGSNTHRSRSGFWPNKASESPQPPRMDAHSRKMSSDHPDDFAQHRMKHEGEKSQPAHPQTDPSRPGTPPPQTPIQRPLHRPRSWHHNGGLAESVNGIGKQEGPSPRKGNGTPPMYEPRGKLPFHSPPSPEKWSNQWPFMSPKKPRVANAASPPYWAIPSCLAPQAQTKSPRSSKDLVDSPQPRQSSTMNAANHALPDSFTFPHGDTQKPAKHPPPLKSHSSESINMNFAPSEWDGKFNATSHECFAPPQSNRKGAATRGRMSPVKNRPIHSKQPPSQSPAGEDHGHLFSGATNSSPPKAPSQPPLPSDHDYSAEEWSKHFKPATFAYPPPPPRSPARGVNRKRTKAPRPFSNATYKRATEPKAASVSAAIDETGDEPDTISISDSVSSKTSGDESAMDIDPAMTPPSAGHPLASGATPGSAQSGHAETTPRPPAPPVPPRPEDVNLNLGDLKKVTPLGPSEEGLGNLNELHTTLPFESRPSNPSTTRPAPQALALPNPPKAPVVPEKLTQSAWERYQGHMRAYMFEWNEYNSKMLSHFNERQSSLEKVLKPGWMSARSDGFNKYLQGVEEDFRVREHWEVSWEKHRDCLRALGTVREKLFAN